MKENKKYFVIEYGCYGNYTKAIIQKIYKTEYDHIVEVDYTIPAYTKEEIHHTRLLVREIKEN